MRNYIDNYLCEVIEIAQKIDHLQVSELATAIDKIRSNRGRIFFAGVGGSAGNCSHAVNDFRKIVGVECYAITDNVSELTARINDEGWSTSFSKWLETSSIGENDALFVLSVGGGSPTTSHNIVEAIDYSKSQGAKVLSIVSRDGGHAKSHGDVCVLIPIVSEERITPHAEEWQGIIWHLVANLLCKNT
jgi:D-sedoheptulose 7-phosphate isomerase